MLLINLLLLFKINTKTKDKVQETNEQLRNLEDAIRQTTTVVKKPTVSNIATDHVKEQQKIEEITKNTVDNISDMEAIKI